MRMKKILLLTFIAFLAVTPLSLAKGRTVVSNGVFQVTIEITNAYYFAADADGIENDIAAEFTLNVEHEGMYCCMNKVVDFYLLASLKCPSGYYHDYLFQFICVLDTYATPTIYFYNHAGEAGWYQVILTCYLPYYANYYVYGSDCFAFDPPGGDEGAGGPLQCEIEL
ncbi:MAG: hypothetical protein K9W42_14055 [Candidatus Heimdallarchaeota archaeon]|nr:hypothetical protein [Candidatus Heimdallarchaeota archaeon]